VRGGAIRRPLAIRTVLPWLLLGLGLVFATEPVWRLLLLGFHPSLDALLEIRCFPVGR